ncbi:hypothetical protein GWI33_008907 [Rhynchophorus ferrugineus]|uniref:Sulfotransferase domain-containing protein n=1 Tax=Rhynchophorus ferrugineus TaxID=354439 RepID=A0A834ISX2_RHYFE|nr:hypothetical protein GWI33_008907 [Rhynchophorus ferrugineus]
MPLYIKPDIFDRASWKMEVEKDTKTTVKNKKWVPFPYNISKIDGSLNTKLLKDFTGERTSFVQVGPEKWFFPSGFAKEADDMYNFQVKSDDVWVITFPRSGTTWTQEMVWLLCNNLDYKTASEEPLISRFPFFEFSCFVHKDLKQELLERNRNDPKNYEFVKNMDYPGWKLLSETKGRRFIKTHLPFSLLPHNIKESGCKIIYIARNPKDVAVSFYHLNRTILTQGYRGDFPMYWDYFENNLQPWTPYWSHIKEGWQHRHDPNVLFIFYEDMNKVNLRSSIEKISGFLEKQYSSSKLDLLEDHLKFENFKNNKSVNFGSFEAAGVCLKNEAGFVRKGQTNGWRNYFDEDLEKRADKWIEENLKDTDLRFPC